jgi:hypothetical protein
MLTWIKKLFNPTAYVEAPSVPEVKTQAQPVEHNPGPTARVARAAGRCATLMDAIEQGDTRPEVRRSLVTYQAQLAAAGLDVPETAAEARKIAGLE